MAEAFLGRNHAAPGDRVLFLGCGAGHTLRAIAEYGLPVSGVDISEEAISWAKEKTDQSGLVADLRVGDVVTLESYPAESFRFVLDDYCLSVCHRASERDLLRERLPRASARWLPRRGRSCDRFAHRRPGAP